MRSLRLFLLLVFAWRLANANEPSSPPLSLVRLTYTGTSTNLAHWSLVGPFFQAGEDEAWNTDHLSAAGVGEADPTAKTFTAFATSCPAGRHGEEIKTPHYFPDQTGEFVDFVDLFGMAYVPGIDPSSVYAACEIQSDQNREAILLLGSADAEKVWLNGTLLHDAATRRGVSTYEEALSISLHTGTNFLLLKVHRWGTAWGLTARIEPSAELAATAALRGQRMTNQLLLKRGLLSAGASIEFAPRGVPRGVKFPAKLKRADGRVIASQDLIAKGEPWHPKLPAEPAIYYLNIVSNGETFVECLLVGDPRQLAAQLLQRSAAYDGDPRVARQLEALRHRVRFLTEPAVTKDDRVLIYTLGELEQTLLLLEAGQEAFRDVPGLHVRAFQSRIDGQAQYYRIFVPSTYRRGGAKLPLVVVLPTVPSASRPFIESVFLAGQSETERMAAIAEKLGVAILWSGYRNRPTGQPCEFAHFDETLNAVADDYAIDPRKITLCGACSGGAIATMTVVRWPERFAGVGVFDPAFQLTKNITAEDVLPFFRSAGFRQWVEQTDVVDAYLTGQRTPTYILHDGTEPGHGELPISLDFATRAAKAGYPLKFEQKPRTLHQHFGAWEELFAWLANQTREHPSSRPNLAFFPSETNPGPIADAFAAPFVVVTGSGGTTADQNEIQRLASAFQEAWSKTHYGPCQVMTERAFAALANQNVNLVLLGNPETCSLWREKVSTLPLRLHEDAVELKERRWQGEHLSVQAVFPDPKDHSRQIVFVGAHDLRDANFGTLDLSAKGWFSFAVWDGHGPRARLVEAQP